MKRVTLYFYNEPDGDSSNVVVCMTKEEILIEYWDFWLSKAIEKYGEGHELITEENCIRDWMITHFAWTEEYEYEGLPDGDTLIVESLDDLDDEQSRTEKQTTE